MAENYKALILDMNDTFMFGGDRFGEDQDFYNRYKELGGTNLGSDTVNSIIRQTYDKLLQIYPHPDYRENFPKVEDTIRELTQKEEFSEDDIRLLTETFAHHELGSVPSDYADAVSSLSKRFRLALVADIWSEKSPWISELTRSGLAELFEVMLFSSDSGMVKPSPRPFLNALSSMGLSPQDAVVVGDSVRRDMGGAAQARVKCILVGGATHPDSHGEATDLIELSQNGIPHTSKKL